MWYGSFRPLGRRGSGGRGGRSGFTGRLRQRHRYRSPMGTIPCCGYITALYGTTKCTRTTGADPLQHSLPPSTPPRLQTRRRPPQRFFQADGSTRSEFRTVYNLHMRIDALSTALKYFDMADVFQIVPSETIVLLEKHLMTLFDLQNDLVAKEEKLATNSADLVAAAEIVVIKEN